MDAKPTEYKGTVYKSKSEAQLALMFDLSINEKKDTSHGVFVYEPERFKTKDNYIPDFLRITTYSDFFVCIHMELIEYKPVMPNKTYVKYLEKQFAEIANDDKHNFIDSYLLYYGTVYNKDVCAMIFNKSECKFNDWSFPVQWMNQFYAECFKYRFDL
jgi:hypothetical protein